MNTLEHAAESNVRLLLIEDDPADALIFSHGLENAPGGPYEVAHATRLAEALALLRSTHFDLAVVDLSLPDSTGEHAVDSLRQAHPNVPIIVLSGHVDAHMVRNILLKGASDCLSKGVDLERVLHQTIHHALKRSRLEAELKQHHRELELSEARLHTVIDNSADAMMIVDAEGRLCFANPAAARMFGRDPEELRDQPFGSLANQADTAEIDIRRRDGSLLVAEIRMVDIEWEGAPCRLASLRDVTRRKQAEEAVRLANVDLELRVRERTRSLEDAIHELESFTYSISHNLRAPVRHIQGYLSLLPEDELAALSESSRRHLRVATDAAEQLGEMIDGLLSFTRIGREPIRWAAIDLTDTVESVRMSLAPTISDRHIEWTVAPLPLVRGDPGMLRDVVLHLLNNAIKYTRGRNPAMIEVGVAGSEGGRIVFFVRDNGAGFEPRYKGELFGVFQRLHGVGEFEGVGIGLSIVGRIISRHGGRVWADGSPGKGATVFFTLEPADMSVEGGERA